MEGHSITPACARSELDLKVIIMSRNKAKTKKTKVIENLYLYEFIDEDAILPDTITVMVQGSRALLIDTAYPEYAEHVKKDLEEQGISVEIIILSHYHSDHVSGCAVFTPCEIYAGEHFEHSYNNCRIWEPGYTYVKPQHLIKDGDSLSFGDFELEFLYAPGHSPCGVITKITERIVHIGDLIMMSKNNRAVLPFIADGGNFAGHIQSLELLKKIEPEIVVVPHGGRIENKENIEKEIEDRIYYLEQTSSAMGTLPLPACLKENISAYDHLEFHDTNLTRLF